MTAAGAAKAAGLLGAAAVLSPLPLLVLGGVALMVLGTVAVVVLTATLSCHPTRQPNAIVVLDRLIAAVSWNRWHPSTTTATPPLDEYAETKSKIESARKSVR